VPQTWHDQHVATAAATWHDPAGHARDFAEGYFVPVSIQAGGSSQSSHGECEPVAASSSRGGFIVLSRLNGVSDQTICMPFLALHVVFDEFARIMIEQRGDPAPNCSDLIDNRINQFLLRDRCLPIVLEGSRSWA
jgi:hypothetical protein